MSEFRFTPSLIVEANTDHEGFHACLIDGECWISPMGRAGWNEYNGLQLDHETAALLRDWLNRALRPSPQEGPE